MVLFEIQKNYYHLNIYCWYQFNIGKIKNIKIILIHVNLNSIVKNTLQKEKVKNNF